MSKTRDTGFINNILKYDNDGNVSIVSGSTTLLFISSSGAIITTGIISGSNALSASYAVSASNAISGSYAVNATTASYSSTGTSASYAASASNAISGAYAVNASNAISSSYATDATNAANSTLFNNTASTVFATTGSNTLTGTQYVSNTNNAIGFSNTTSSIYTDGGLQVTKDAYLSSSLYIKGNLTVYGTQSVSFITSSQLNISTNVITVNTNTPSIRFGGLSVYDSGSTGATGSIFWDSQNNHWIYSNPSGSSYSGGMLISGPRNTGSLGDEQGTTLNAIMKGMGGDHITSSGIFEVSGSVGIGKSTPNAKLEIESERNSTLLRLTATSGENWDFKNTNTTGTTDVLSIGANGATANLNLLDNGYVGIGTTSIPHSLTIVTPSGVGSGIQISKSGYVTSFLGDGGSGYPVGLLSMYDSGSQKVQIYAGGVSYLTGGNVGIGITNPSSQLHISGNSGSAFTDGLRINRNGNASQYTVINHTGGSSNFTTVDTSGNNIAEMYFQRSVNGTAVTSSMMINTNGFVGIGTSDPGQTLEVRSANGQGIRFKNAGSSDKRWDFVGSGNDFRVNETGVGAVMTFEAGGNIGIGTTDPLARLQVGNGAQTAINGAENKIHIASATSGGRSALLTLANSSGAVTVEGQFESSAETSDLRVIIGSTSNHDVVLRTNNAERIRVANSGLIILKGRQTNTTQGNCVNMQEWVAYGQTITAGSFINLFNIKGQYDNITGDFYSWIDQGSWTGYTCRFLIGYGGFGITAALGNSSAFTLSMTGTTYNETLRITNNSSNVNNSNICVRLWGRYISDGVGSGGTDLITTSYLTRIS